MNARPGPSQGGLCVWLTGLSGAGKTSTAVAARALLQARGLPVRLLDGDELRLNRCSDLGFSPSDRDRNVLRVAGFAKELVDLGHIVICATISPYRRARSQARQIVGGQRFLEVFIDSPLALCEKRDPKGLYARARAGTLTGFTGIDSPYEPPLFADLVLSTLESSVEQNAVRLIARIESHDLDRGEVAMKRSA